MRFWKRDMAACHPLHESTQPALFTGGGTSCPGRGHLVLGPRVSGGWGVGGGGGAASPRITCLGGGGWGAASPRTTCPGVVGGGS